MTKRLLVIIKSYYLVVIICLLGLCTTVTLQCFYNDLLDHFITPSTEKMEAISYEHDTYIVSTYLSTDQNSLNFITTLKELEKDYDIPFYLVDITKYPDVIDNWGITYTPTYFVMTKSDYKYATLLYKAYGNKSATTIAEEAGWIEDNGIPENELGVTKEIENYASFKFLSSQYDNEVDNLILSFEIENLTSEDIVIDTDNFAVKSLNTSNLSITKVETEEILLEGDSFTTISVNFTSSDLEQLELDKYMIYVTFTKSDEYISFTLKTK